MKDEAVNTATIVWLKIQFGYSWVCERVFEVGKSNRTQGYRLMRRLAKEGCTRLLREEGWQ